MDEKIIALIAKGKARIHQEEEEQAYQERQEQERIKAQCDAIDNLMRQALPYALQPYLVPTYESKDNRDIDIEQYQSFMVEIQVPELAPFKVKLIKEEGHWNPKYTILPTKSWGESEGEPYLSYLRAWETFPIEDLDRTLVVALQLQEWYASDHDRWLTNQTKKNVQYVPVDPDEDCVRIIKEQIRSIVRQEMSHVGG